MSEVPEDLVAQALRAAMRENRELRHRLERLDEPIAIVGMACRYPGDVRSPDELWELIARGDEAIRTVPSARQWARGPHGLPRGGFLTAPGLFDPAPFDMSDADALHCDPQHRLLLTTAWEALERARIAPDSLTDTDTGVFVGVIFHDYEQRAVGTGPPYFGSAGGSASGRLAYHFGTLGPSMTFDAACASSLVAVHTAKRALQRGECSLALAGGASVMATSQLFDANDQLGGAMLAGDGRCKSFSADADGMGLAEGAGVVVLERLSDALRRDHPVLAVVRGSAVGANGTANGFMAPRALGEERVLRAALDDAGLAPDAIDVVEGHGTGTPIGDLIEVMAVDAVFGRDRDDPLWLGSIKSNIGHTQAAGGIAGMLKTVLAMHHGVVPASVHAQRPTEGIDWAASRLRLATASVDWQRKRHHPRRAGVSAFGANGTNAHVILEQWTAVTPERPAREGPATVRVSAADPGALMAMRIQLAGHVEKQSGITVTQLAHAVEHTRAHLRHEGRFTAHTPSELAAQLRDPRAPVSATGTTPPAASGGLIDLPTYVFQEHDYWT